MYPLLPQTVHLVLQHISPLTDPLPPHLISTPLRQRHHFLQLSPSSPVEYLCWPSPDNANIIDILDHPPFLFDQTSYLTRYTSDPESIFAHAQVSSGAKGLRMLFHWDDIHGWKYHDLRLMPFPSSSFSTPEESLATNSARRKSPPRHSSLDLVVEADHTNGDGDDSYWDAYGAAEHDLTSPSPLQSNSKPETADGEAAYWAQYASVQGSADSTIPSPLPVNCKLRPVNSQGTALPFPSNNGLIIDAADDAILPRPLISMLGPPSPSILAHLLNTISPRKDVYSSDIDDPYSSQTQSTHTIDPSPEQTIEDSELATPPLPNGYLLDPPIASPNTVEVDEIPLSQCRPCPLSGAEDKALTDSIRGLYYLWKAGRKQPVEKDKTAFLRIVQATIACE